MGCAHKSCKSAPGRARVSRVASVHPLPHTPPAHRPELLSVSKGWDGQFTRTSPLAGLAELRWRPKAAGTRLLRHSSGLGQLQRRAPGGAGPMMGVWSGCPRGRAESGGVVMSPKRQGRGWGRGHGAQEAGREASRMAARNSLELGEVSL